jgi:hypothetical protein
MSLSVRALFGFRGAIENGSDDPSVPEEFDDPYDVFSFRTPLVHD